MNAKIDYQTTVINTLKEDIADMAYDASKFSVNPGKDFTRKRKMDFYNLIMFLIVMGNSNTDYELVKYFNFDSEFNQTCVPSDNLIKNCPPLGIVK